MKPNESVNLNKNIIMNEIILPQKIKYRNKYKHVQTTDIVIYTSYDLDKFKNHPLNRSTVESKVDMLVESFKKQYFLIPAIVVQSDDELLVVDGGNRLKALQKYNSEYNGSEQYPKLPFYFLVYKKDAISISDIRRINGCTSNWKLEDYCVSYLKEGIPAFILLNKLRNKYENISITILIGIISGCNCLSRYVFSSLKEGKLPSIGEAKSVEICEKMNELNSISKIFTLNKTVRFALLRLVSIEGYNHERFVSKIKKHKRLLEKIQYHNKVNEYGTDFDYVYNYKEKDILDIARVFNTKWVQTYQKKNT